MLRNVCRISANIITDISLRFPVDFVQPNHCGGRQKMREAEA
jgi:hypothetical protein